MIVIYVQKGFNSRTAARRYSEVYFKSKTTKWKSISKAVQKSTRNWKLPFKKKL